MGPSLKTRLCMVFLEHPKALASLPASEYTSRSTLPFRDPIFSVRLYNASQALKQQMVCGMWDNTLLEQNRIFVLPTTTSLKNAWPLWPPDHLHTYNTNALETSDHGSLSHRARLTEGLLHPPQLMIQRWAWKSAFHWVWNFWSFLCFDAQKQHLRIETRQ